MERKMEKKSGWWLMAGSLVLVGALSILGTAREQAKAVAAPVASTQGTHAAATNAMEPAAANADVDVLDMQLD